MKSRKIVLLVLALFVFTVLFAGCGNDDVAASENGAIEKPATENEISEVLEETSNTSTQLEMIRMGEGGTDFPTPWMRSNKGGGSRKHMLIYDSLLEKDNKGLTPWLAESYEIEDDGVTYIFKLRDNIIWHDGEQMTAEDVAFTFEYCNEFVPVSSSLDFDDIESVEVIDKLTAKIVAKQVSATLLENIGKVSIVPKHIWEKVEDPYSYDGEDALIGSGPYILAERKVSDSVMIYKAYDEFWGPKPATKMLYWMNVADEVIAFENDEVDIARSLSVDEIPMFENKDIYKIIQGPAFSGSRLLFNMSCNQVLAQKEFRQAVYYAFDSAEMIAKIGGGLGELSNPGILPPAHIMYNPDVKQYDHSEDMANEILDKLGYSEIGEDGIRMNSEGERLSFELLASERNGRLDTAKLFAEQMARVGIEFVVVGMEGKTQEERVANDDFVTAIVGHAGLGNDADYLRERYAGGDLGTSTTELSSKGYSNPEVMKLLKEQRTITNFEERKDMIYKIQDLMAEDAIEIMMYYGYMTSAHRPAVWDGWMYCYDSRSVTSCKLSFVLYEKWREENN